MPKMFLTVSDIEAKLTPGDIIHVFYDDFNEGHFDLRFHRILRDDSYLDTRVVAEFQYNDMPDWSEPDDYFYEFEGVVCRGSGAERLYWNGLVRRA